MDVFLIPVGDTRYELYCEPSEADQPSGGVAAQVLRRARDVVRAEQEARRDRRAARRAGTRRGADSWMTRARSGLTRALAEWVAQQRLLWHLRHVDDGVLVHPEDLASEEAMSIARGRLQDQIDHHRFWMVMDGVGVLVFGPLFFFVPGPNLISWYFAAKMAGHWLAFQGARRGVAGVEWSPRVSAVLSAVRQTLALPPGARRPRLRALSRELGLEHLATFLERTAPHRS